MSVINTYYTGILRYTEPVAYLLGLDYTMCTIV